MNMDMLTSVSGTIGGGFFGGLMDKFSSEQKSEYIMDVEIFDKFRDRLQKCLGKELKELEI
jgi:hypothetical protein